jgi:hypothetical protein
LPASFQGGLQVGFRIRYRYQIYHRIDIYYIGIEVYIDYNTPMCQNEIRPSIDTVTTPCVPVDRILLALPRFHLSAATRRPWPPSPPT